MYQDYDQNDYPSINGNNRDTFKEADYHYHHEGNSLNYSNNYSNDYNYYRNNNYHNHNNYKNYNHYRINNLTSINETSSQNTSIEKREENIPKNLKLKTIENSINSKYLSKVTIENIRQPKEVLLMLNNFLTENDYDTNYKHSIEKNKISFIFNEEEIAFNFTKLLNNMKNRNPIYQNVNVHLSLTPNNNYNKTKDGKNKRGLSIDSIQRLFNGLGAKKHDKSKVKLNLDLGGSSPFLYPYEKKRNKRNKNSPENSSFDNKLKDYNKLPIRVLDTNYKPLRSPEFREENKDKWICPSNFKW